MHPFLCNETAYSFKGSTLTIEDLISHAKNHGFSHMVLCDTTMHAAYKFYHQAIKAGIKPIIGLQFKLESTFDSMPLQVAVYAHNQQGYQQLLKLASVSAVYQIVTFETLKTYGDEMTLVVDTSEGEVAHLLNQKDHKAVKTLFETLRTLTQSFYLGVGDQALKTQFNVPCVPFYRAMYLQEDDAPTHDVLKRILQVESQSTQAQPLNLVETLSQDLDAELAAFLSKHALSLTFKEARLPSYQTPDDIPSDKYLRALSKKGLGKRLSKTKKPYQAYEKRLEKELKTIHELGYDDYFLIMWDVIKYARSEHILVGPGRGSAPGSLVSYALGITSVDPIEHGLLFERFLNAARMSMPDIDVDFPDRKRDQVVRYVKERFGETCVALICTFGTFLTKSALRDSARVLNVDKRYVEEAIQTVKNYDSVSALFGDADVKNRMKQDETLKTWFHAASKLEGLPRHVSTHAAGVVLTDQPLIDYTAIQPGLNTMYQTQYEQADLEDLGLLKMDFLGLRNLTLIEDVVEQINIETETLIDVYKLPIDDEATFRMLRDKSTTGIFQLESDGMRQLIKQMKIRCFDDIQVVLALYRPGPMESIPHFLARRFNKENVEQISVEIDDILKPTQGILLYQEQIMAIAVRFAGYSLNEADLLRRSVSKKDANTLEKERKHFIKKATEQNRDKALAERIYDYIVKFANYGFNKSHSVAYGLVAYWMAYLKANYPAQFLAVLMQSALNNASSMRHYMQELHEYGLKLISPDINLSTDRFVKKNHALYYPLSGIKNIGKTTIEAFKALKSVDTTSYAHFVKSTQGVFNKRHHEYLIYSGACDGFKLNKRTMKENLDALLHFLDYDESFALSDFVFERYEEYDEAILREKEIEAIGFNIRYDEFKTYEPSAVKHQWLWPTNLKDAPLHQKLTVIARITRLKTITTKQGKNMAFITLSDRAVDMDSVCFPQTYMTSEALLKEQTFKIFEGVVKLKDGSRQFVIDRVRETRL